MEYKNIINIKIKDFQLTENNTYKCLNKQFVDTEHLYIFDYNRSKIFHINIPINTLDEDIPNILEEYGLKESECNYMITEFPCKTINLTYEDKIVNKEDKIQELLQNEKIIRNKLKINASINNSKIFKKIQQEYGTFYNYLKTFTQEQIIYETDKTTNQLSDVLSKDLQKRGMKFVGSTIIYSYLQAIGVIYSHDRDCFLYKEN